MLRILAQMYFLKKFFSAKNESWPTKTDLIKEVAPPIVKKLTAKKPTAKKTAAKKAVKVTEKPVVKKLKAVKKTAKK